MKRLRVAKSQKPPTQINHVKTESGASASSLHRLLRLQQPIGNQSIQRLIRSPFIQAKLQVSTPEDESEQEADRVADTVMRMPEPAATAEESPRIQAKPLATRITPLVQRAPEEPSEEDEEEIITKPIIQRAVPSAGREDDEEKVAAKLYTNPNNSIQRTCSGCEDELSPTMRLDSRSKNNRGAQVQGKGEHPVTTGLIPPVSANLRAMQGGGSPLPPASRAIFEARFGHDFSQVRIDTSNQAAEVTQALNARAFTLANYIAFAPGQYTPGTEQGDRLLAHELTHTVQQNSTNQVRRRRLSALDEEQEQEVIEKGDATPTPRLMRALASGEPSPAIGTAPGSLLQRSPDDETLEETAGKITERNAEKTWSKTSEGITEQEKPGEKFLLMNFAIRQADLKKEHKEFLTNTIYFGTLTSDPMAKIVIVGHADSTGAKGFNEVLAKRRAREVEKALRQMGRHNLRIETVTGRGTKEPIDKNESVFGRARNRRVEILVTPWQAPKPVPELLTELQKGMKPFVVKVDNFAACPFQDTVKKIVEDAFKAIPTIQFDWEGMSASSEAFISFDDTSTFSTALGLSGDIILNSFKNNKICKVPGDDKTCEKVFPETADVMGRAIANTVAHETGHAFALDHVPATDNYMWSPELHPLNGKTNKTFDEQIHLKRTLQSVTETFSSSQLVHIANRIKEKRKSKPGVVEFE